MKRKGLLSMLAGLMALSVLLSACGGSGSGVKIDKNKDYGEVKMGYQFGTSYLPIVAVIENGLLTKRINVKVTKQQLAAGGPLTEAMLSGSTDIGFMGLGPFFVGWAKGVDWKIATAMEDMPIGLNSIKPGAKTLKDVGPNDKIALPGPNSIQHVMLAMELKKQGMDPRALDKNLVGMSHPDGEKALYSKAALFHYTAPPFLERELKQPGVTRLFDSYQTLGQPHTFNVAVVTAKFKKERPEVYQAFIEAMDEAIKWINEKPEEAADLLIKMGDKSKKEDLVAQIKDKNVVWTMEPHGLMKLAQFMHEAKFISKMPKDWKEVTWENLHTLKGN